MTTSELLRVIVPMKPAYEGKSRLAEVLDPEGRAALSLLLLQHVLRAVALAATPQETRVVGGDEWVRSVASKESARWQEDPGGGLNEAVRHGANKAFQDGAPAILVLPGDLGLLEPHEVDALLALSDGLRRVVLARAVTDGGTNAIMAPRGQLVGPCFGPESFARHLEEARKASIPVEVAQASGLGFDLDTPEDLLVYRQEWPGLDQALTSWREKLRSWASVRTE